MWILILLLLIVGAVALLGAVAVTSQYNSQLTVTRIYSGGDVAPGDNTITINGLNTSETLNAGTTPAVSKSFDAVVTLSSGTATLDLTAIVDAVDGATVTITGLTPAHFKFYNPAANANAITITFGASNGYTGFGSAFSVTLAPGGEILLRLGAIVVDSSHKTLDITGTGAQTLKVEGTAG